MAYSIFTTMTSSRFQAFASKLSIISLLIFALSFPLSVKIMVYCTWILSISAIISYIAFREFKLNLIYIFPLFFYVIRLASFIITDTDTKFLENGLSFILIPLAFCVIKINGQQLQFLLKNILWGYLAICVIILTIYATKIIIPGHFLEAIIRPKSFHAYFLVNPIHGHPSFLISILAFIIPLSFYLNYTLKKINSYIMILGIVLVITCTYISGARIGVVINLCLLILSMIFYRKELNTKIKIAGLTCGVAIVILVVFNASKFSSDPIRSELFRVGIETIKKNPWKGSGIESMRKYIHNAEFNVAEKYGRDSYLQNHFHNQLIDEIVQFGIPAGVIFILFWMCCLKTAIQRKDYLLYCFIAIYIVFINVDSSMGAAKGLVPILFWLCLIFSTQNIRLQPYKSYLKNHE
jgi:O-antigen ligase